MLHLLMLSGSLVLTVCLRWLSGVYLRRSSESPDLRWQVRWQRAWQWFALPPLLLLTTATALLVMGPICHMSHHQMIHGWSGYVTYGFAFSSLLWLLGLIGDLLFSASRAWWQLRDCESVELDLNIDVMGQPSASLDNLSQPLLARKLSTQLPFVAQVGLWQPQLVVSQGFLTCCDRDHIVAVVCHEVAHRHYRDTLWFAVLGVLRRWSQWLPQTQNLWEELLLLRELRADRWAAQRVDPLLLAEALYTLVSHSQSSMSAASDWAELGAAFDEVLVRDRLNERVDALLQPQAIVENPEGWMVRCWSVAVKLLLLTIACSPLLTLLWHQ